MRGRVRSTLVERKKERKERERERERERANIEADPGGTNDGMCNNSVIAVPLPGSTFTGLLQDSFSSLLLCLVSCCPHLTIRCRRMEEKERENGREREKEQEYEKRSGRSGSR